MRTASLIALFLIAWIARAETKTPRRQQLAADDPYHLDRAGAEPCPAGSEPAVLASGGDPRVLHSICPPVRRLTPRMHLTAGSWVHRAVLDFAGRRLATCGNEAARVWDLTTGKVLFELPSFFADLSGDGKTVLLTRDHGREAFDVDSGRLLWARSYEISAPVAVGADLFLLEGETRYELVDARNGQILDTYDHAPHVGLWNFGLMSADGALYTTPPDPQMLSREQAFALVNIAVGLQHLGPYGGTCRFTDGGKHAVVATGETELQQVDFDDAGHPLWPARQPVKHLPTWKGSVAPGGRYMVAHCAACCVAVFDLLDGREIADGMPKPDDVMNTAVSGDGRTACGLHGTEIDVFDLSSVLHP